MKKNVIFAGMFAAGLLLASLISGFIPAQTKKPWPVPDAYKNKKNPVASNAASIAAGKELWNTNCKSCHGAKGLGDGSKAAQLKTEPGDFSTADVQSQTDGSMFYKIAEGRDDMPSFKKKIPDEEDIWSLVVFARTLKK
ncbi:MAG TPA: c-type cytochrome [Puia sp.]|nr:c-type cytochrome [Puia sp.]